MGFDLLNDLVVRVSGLDIDLPHLIFATGTTGDLLDHIESTLIATKIGIVKDRVGIQHSDHSDTLKVQAFCDHLRTDKNIGFMRREVLDYIFVGIFVSRSVEVHSCDTIFIEDFVQIISDAFCAVAVCLHAVLTTDGTKVGQSHGITTVVATQLTNVSVKDERDVAIFAFRDPSTFLTLHHRSISTPILKHYHLLTFAKRFS